ncbi:MAG: hypothetical protein JO023_28675 [Chloroflexi bacterium]|nr:hypothetical protein [Chloroflexota bacterium]
MTPLDPVSPGATTRLFVTLTKTRASPSVSPVTVIVVLPTGLTFLDTDAAERWRPTQFGQIVILSSSAPLASGETRSLTLLLTVEESASTSSIAVSATPGPTVQTQLSWSRQRPPSNRCSCHAGST